MKHLLDQIAEEYVELMLAKIPHDPWDIYGYLDGPRGKRTAPIDRNRTIYLYTPIPQYKDRSVAEIHGEAAKSCRELDELAKENNTPRVNFLRSHMNSLKMRTEMLLGAQFSFQEMTRGLYGLTAPEYPEEMFADVLDELNQVLPGKGSLLERVESFRQKMVVPSNKLAATMTSAVEAFHDIAVERMGITKDSAPRLSFYGFGPHRKGLELDGYVYDWEWDRINWEIVFSTDHAFAIDDIISFSCHEVEPGHLTFIGLRTKAAYENGCPELAVIAQFNESSAFIEGAARMSIDLCLPGEELFAFERDLLFPLAGIDKGLAECLPAWHKFRKATNFAKLVLERNRWDGKWSKEEGIAWMKQYMLAPPQDCAALVDHLAADPGHFVAHDYSREVITNYVYDKEPTWEGRWKLYRELSMAHISMRAIEDRSFQL